MVEPSIYLQELSPYSTFILAIRSAETKKKYVQRFQYFINLINVLTGRSIEERCNALGEMTKNNPRMLIYPIFTMNCQSVVGIGCQLLEMEGVLILSFAVRMW